MSQPLINLTRDIHTFKSNSHSTQTSIQKTKRVTSLTRTFSSVTSHIRQSRRTQHTVTTSITRRMHAPLATLRTNLRRVHSNLISPSTRQLTNLRSRILQLNHIISSLNQLTTTRSPAISITRVTISLTARTRQTVRTTHPLYSTTKISLQISMIHRISILNSPSHVTRVLKGLLSGITHCYQPKSSTIIQISIRNNCNILTITSANPNVDPRSITRTFSQFRQNRATIKVAKDNLNLSIIETLIHTRNNRISLISAPNRNAAIAIHLPLH